MRELELYLYNTFSDQPFGGNVSWIVPRAGDLSDTQMSTIAAELALPATAFLSDAQTSAPGIRFFSPAGEFDMCGHAIVGALCCLADLGLLGSDACGAVELRLQAPPGEIPATVQWDADGRPRCRMVQRPPWFKACAVEHAEAAPLLGLAAEDMDYSLPIETGSTGLKHVFLPVLRRDGLAAIVPDFDGLAALSHSLGVESVCVFSLDTGHPRRRVRSRDFCPAIGVPEEAASGSTNGALASYLFRHGRVAAEPPGELQVVAEQGVEMGRPSLVSTELKTQDGAITRVMVSGQATRLVCGTLRLPPPAPS